MKITLTDRISTSTISALKPGDFFHFANGKETEEIFIALSEGDDGYNHSFLCRNLGTGQVKKVSVTNKERVILFVYPAEIIFKDNASPWRGEIENVDKPQDTAKANTADA